MYGRRPFGAERIACDGFDVIPAATVINFLCVHSPVMTETRKATYVSLYKSHSIFKGNSFTYEPMHASISLPE